MLELANASERRRQGLEPRRTESPIKHIALIGNFPPRRCGIATFTADLHDTLTRDADIGCDVYAMDDQAEPYAFPDKVTFAIRESVVPDYLEAARRINASNAELVCIQHEYGIFGDRAGERILSLLSALEKPVVVALHTVLAEPNPDQMRVMEHVIAYASKLIVMTRKGRDLLRTVHGAPASKIAIVPHGAPDRPLLDTAPFKKRYGFADRDVLFTFGLLSPNKGIETVIRALPAIKAANPKVLYVVLGATHPRLVASDGEAYREGLQALANELGIADSVAFINEYTDTERLIDYIGAADIYVTPYLSKSQITSGTLSYAVALGKPVVSTPYWHACELLDQDRGVLVPFDEPVALAAEVNALFADTARRETMRQKAYAAGREMIWPHVALKYAKVLRDALPSIPLPIASVEPIVAAPSMLAGVDAMTDSCGILQHGVGCVPDRSHGYCLDDNARGLLLTQRIDASGSRSALSARLALTYAAFVQHAWNDGQGRFRNFMSFERHWLEEVGSQDSFGRAVWSLGATVELSATAKLKAWAGELLGRALPYAPQMTSLRAQSFIILGLAAALRGRHDWEAASHVMAEAAEALLGAYTPRRRTDWPWFEEVLAYDNARLPEALIRGGLLLDDRGMVDAGLEALTWLCEMQTAHKGCFQPVGSDSFGRKQARPQPFDQQPIEAAATIDAASAAFDATGDRHWQAEAQRAYNWFLGANVLGAPIAHVDQAVCMDGLTRNGVNVNQGAESVLSFALAACAIRALNRATSPGALALA